MIKMLFARLQQGHQTIKFPDGPPPAVPDQFRGRPSVDESKCRPEECQACASACPTEAIDLTGKVKIDLGKCLFCTDCLTACPEDAITLEQDHRLAVRQRQNLVVEQGQILELATKLDAKAMKLFGRSLALRQVSAGGCNACEADTNVLNTVGWDLSRFGIQFVASPRHADGLLITGPVTENMRQALRKAYDAVPEPKLVIAVGACAISGGPYINHPETLNGASAVVPVDLYIPGCPPHPLTILDGLLRLLGKLEVSAKL